MLVLQSTMPDIPELDRSQARGDLEYLSTVLDDMVYVWPVARHTRTSLRQLLQAATNTRR